MGAVAARPGDVALAPLAAAGAMDLRVQWVRQTVPPRDRRRPDLAAPR